MTYDIWLRFASDTLAKSGNATARLDAQLLLVMVTKHDRSYILAHPEEQLDKEQLRALSDALQRRTNGEPIAYIVGNKEFYGRDFVVTTDVLIPRPESESFIEVLNDLSPKDGQMLLDIGTGSGVLAITAKKEFPSLVVAATDISVDALQVAKNNASRLRADIQFVRSDLFANINDSYDYIFANLPYVPTTLEVTTEVHTEPALAVFSGTDGIDCIREFIPQAAKYLNDNGYVFVESLTSQHDSIKSLCHKHGLKLTQTAGLVQLYHFGE